MLFIATLLLSSSVPTPRPKSVIRITEATSRRPVLLVGSMHYNPASIEVVRSTVKSAASSPGLHATAIELCPARWNSTVASTWSRSGWRRMLAEDEFQVAFETATDCGLADVALADQAIETTARRLVESLLATLRDLLTPAGWRLISADLQLFLRQLPAFGSAMLDAGVLAGMPLAAARYLYQSPAALPFVSFSVAALGLAAAIDEATGALPAWEDGVLTLFVAIVLGRTVFISLIQERNLVLARNIRQLCLDDGGEDAATAAAPQSAEDVEAKKVVVAVLGMAHLEGVRQALIDEGFDA